MKSGSLFFSTGVIPALPGLTVMNGLKLQVVRSVVISGKACSKILFASYIVLFPHFLHCIADARFL